jgi:hypothetical protein
MLHKQHRKGLFQSAFVVYPCGKAGGLQIRRCQGIAVCFYGFTLGVLALQTSGSCNDWASKEGMLSFYNRLREANHPFDIRHSTLNILRFVFLNNLNDPNALNVPNQ